MSTNDSRTGSKIGLERPDRRERDVTVVRTYLGMREPSALRRSRAPRTNAELLRLHPCTTGQWRALYASVGSAWQWHERDGWPDAQLAARLASASVHVFAVRLIDDGIGPPAAAADSELVGMLELEQGEGGDVEIVYLGLDRRLMGQGLGAWLVAEAVDRAFALEATRVWLHTCTLDSASALPNYLARGFIAERTETYTARLSE